MDYLKFQIMRKLRSIQLKNSFFSKKISKINLRNLLKWENIKRIPGEFIYVAADILAKGIAFVILPLYTHRMSVDEFGLFSLYQIYSAIFAIFISLSFSRVVVLYFINNKNKNKNLTTTFWLIILSSIITSIIVLLLDYINILMIDTNILIILLITTTFSSFYSIGLEVIRAKKNAIKYSIVNLSNIIITNLLALILIYSFTEGFVLLRLIAILIVSFVFGSIFLIIVVKDNGFKFDKNTLLFFIKYGLPLIPFAFASLMLSYFDRLFLEYFRSATELGLYSFAYNIAMFLFAIVIALNRAMQPVFFENYSNYPLLKKRIVTNLYLFVSIYLVFLILSKPMVVMLGDVDYLDSIKILPLLALALGFYYLYTLYENVLLYNKKSKVVSLISLISLFLTVLVNFLLVPKYGYIGAAISTIVSYFAIFIISFFYVKLKYNYKVLSYKLLIGTIMVFSLTSILGLIFFI
jgi:O-antigen/teichoic acid export membrane protein